MRTVTDPKFRPRPASVAILEFGRLLHEADQGVIADRNPSRVSQVEDELVTQLSKDKNTLLKPALNFNASKPIDSLALRVLALTAYLQLATNRRTIAISDVSKAVCGGDMKTMIEARQVITQLLFGKQLALRENTTTCIELGEPVLHLLAGGKQAMPLEISEWELCRRWHKAEVEAKRRETGVSLPTPKELAAKLAEQVIGLEAQIRTFACRMALHQRRAAMIRAGHDPGSTPCNEALLLIGPSGCGKTFLAENAGRVSRLPFASISSGDITAEGFVGLSVEDSIRRLLAAANGDVESARFGLIFMDEWDKKAATETNWRDIGGVCVQAEMLRLMEGTDIQVGGRRGGLDHTGVMFNTRGTMWLFGGAFVGLEGLLNRPGTRGIGFGSLQGGSRQQRFVFDALVDFGMIPEFVNRLSGILVFPAPTVEQLIQIASRCVIPAYKKLLASCGADIQVAADGIRLMAECAAETKTFARGVKTVVARLIEDAVFEERRGVIELGITEVRRAIEATGFAAQQ